MRLIRAYVHGWPLPHAFMAPVGAFAAVAAVMWLMRLTRACVCTSGCCHALVAPVLWRLHRYERLLCGLCT
jgi:hypothetical protein